jgi:hypothetical protein
VPEFLDIDAALCSKKLTPKHTPHPLLSSSFSGTAAGDESYDRWVITSGIEYKLGR